LAEARWISKLKALDEAQNLVAEMVAKSLVLNESKDEWKDMVKTYVKDPKNIDPEVTEALAQISSEYNESNMWSVIALYKSAV